MTTVVLGRTIPDAREHAIPLVLALVDVVLVTPYQGWLREGLIVDSILITPTAHHAAGFRQALDTLLDSQLKRHG